MFVKSCLLLLVLPTVLGHMGVSSPVSLDAAIGDAYRYPVVGGGQTKQACHGKAAGAKYTWLWTPKSSGTCEIYQNCWASEPTNLKMSFGAAHDGGLCKLYECTGSVTLPLCKRMELPDSFGTCTMIASTPDCTLKGSMPGRSGGASPVAPTSAPPAGSPTSAPPAATTRCGTSWVDANAKCGAACNAANAATVCPGADCFADLQPCTPSSGTPPPTAELPVATPTTVRCGTSWEDANSRCGTQCTNNGDCTVAGEVCFVDLNNCPSGSTKPVTKSPTPSVDMSKCVSSKPHISDLFCKSVSCAPAYKDYCSITESSKQAPGLRSLCQLYAVAAGETWADVASKYDTTEAKLKTQNPAITTLAVTNVLEIPGDCGKAKEEAETSSSYKVSAVSSLFTFMLISVTAAELLQ